MGRLPGDGTRVTSGVALVLVCGRKSAKEWPLLLQNSAFSLGNGRRIRFWKDVWCGEEVLCSLFPSMFSLAVQKDAMVSDMWNHFREEGGWAPTFLRPLNDWEMEEVGSFLSFIHMKKIRLEIEDNLLVKGSRLGNFLVRTMYNGLDSSVDIDFPVCPVWNAVIPSKISFFTWEASRGKVMTLEQLKRHGRYLVNKCCLCEEDEETIDHLLIHCNTARMHCVLFLTIVGTTWVFPHSVRHTLLAWQGAHVGKKQKRI